MSSSTWQPFGPTLLFCPADRPDRFAKAAAAADVVILDLEDGVNAADRSTARQALADVLLDPQETMVGINPVGSIEHSLDLAAIASTPYRTLILAKTESADQVTSLGNYSVVALCKTARGILESGVIAKAAQTVALMWGAEDLVASLGGTSSRTGDGLYREFARYARSHVLLNARSHGRVAIDSVYLNIPDFDGLRREVEDGVASGFGATACIHPTQAAVIREAYRPSDVEVSWATGVFDAAKNARGVFTYEGKMVDAPLFRQAELILKRARYFTS